jgi:hypothetical protein
VRRQRVVLPRSRRGVALATIESPRDGRKNLGRGEKTRFVLHLREALLVVQHVQLGGFRGYPPTALSG